ncbi:MAG: hypothetical protein WD071_01550 [Pseudohongiella sp.]|uniref:hypothetical protein n=1 Tax=Pseudohongiella sp. TaxID=1979412 RepID=UPI00349FECF4
MGLRFCPEPSGALTGLYCALHMTAALAVVTSAVPAAGKVLLAVLLVVQAVAQLRHATLQADTAIVAVDFDVNDSLLELANGRRIPVVVSQIYCVPCLQVVRLQRRTKQADSFFSFVVFPDSADADTRRLLRACLLKLSLRPPDDQRTSE